MGILELRTVFPLITVPALHTHFALICHQRVLTPSIHVALSKMVSLTCLSKETREPQSTGEMQRRQNLGDRSITFVWLFRNAWSELEPVLELFVSHYISKIMMAEINWV